MAELLILGPLELKAAAGGAGLGGDKPRRLLGALALCAGEVIAADLLAEVVWGDSPPRSAHANLLTYVSSLRRALRPCAGLCIEARPPGYRLLADSQSADWLRFRAQADSARDVHAADPGKAGVLLREALGLWRGPVLADVADGLALLLPRIAALEEARLSVQVLCVEADLMAGRHGEILGELAKLTREHPLHEQLRGQHMVALYRCGRQADALAVFSQLRGQLRDELGIDPEPGLRSLYTDILNADPRLAVPPTGPAAISVAAPVAAVRPAVPPRQLPGGVSAFTGRRAEFSRLDELLSRDRGRAPVAVISGLPGVGKTALVLHWAHRVQGRYADGTLFADLRGHAPQAVPRRPGEVLDGFLRALGVRDIPPGEEERAAAFRTALDGKSVLIVLDNAVSPGQVRPLLPGSAGCLVLVTSRGQLSGLAIRDGATAVPLAPLAEPEAVALLRRILPGQRVDAEPRAAAELAGLCAGLPLALRIAAERAAVRPGLRLAGLVSQLSAERGRLDLLASADDESSAVRPAFWWSYRALPSAPAGLFRLLGLHPGADISDGAAAALAGLASPRTRHLLGTLAGANLIQEGPPGRYRLHDLLRLYAAERARSESSGHDRAVAIRRLLCWYLRTAQAADQVLMPHRPRPDLGPSPQDCEPLAFTSHDRALAWCDAELANLAAASLLAAETGEHAVAWQLPAVLWSYFYHRAALDPWIAMSGTGLASARRTANRPAEAWMLSNLASGFLELNEPGRALRYAEQALAIRRETGDVPAVARSLGMAADALVQLGRPDEAAETIAEALAIVRGLGDLFMTGVALDTLGRIHQHSGRAGEAIACLRQAIDIFSDLGERLYQGLPEHNLAGVYRSIGDDNQALAWYERALVVRRRAGDLAGQAQTLLDVGDLHHDRGRASAAHDVWRQALAIYRRAGDQHRSALARSRLEPLGGPPDSARSAPDGHASSGWTAPPLRQAASASVASKSRARPA